MQRQTWGDIGPFRHKRPLWTAVRLHDPGPATDRRCRGQELRLSKDPGRSGLDFFLRWNIFSNLPKRRLWHKMTGAFGRQGDVYFMANGQVWHGRLPNMHGRKTMICLMGCEQTSPDYASVPLTVPDDVISRLPPRFRKGVGGPFEINDPTGTIVDRLVKERRPASVFSLEYWVKLERRLAEWISDRASR